MINSGMRDAGYLYVNIDDEWTGERDASGIIHPNRNFPDMKRLADYLHKNGMKLGLYSSPGPETCEGHLGSLGHEDQDAATYASWGVDYLKYDWCSAAFVYQDSDMHAVYQRMGEALQKTGRPMVYSLCQYGKSDVSTWGRSVAGNLWRTTPDISDSWKSMIWIWSQQEPIRHWSYRGGWNDPDMLEVGNGGMSIEEYKTHFSLWAMLSAPLLAGNDPRSMSAETAAILTNREVIAVDQDPLGSAPEPVQLELGAEVWTKRMKDRSTVVLILNRAEQPANVNLSWSQVGIKGNFTVRDLWAHSEISAQTFRTPLAAHTVRMFRIYSR